MIPHKCQNVKARKAGTAWWCTVTQKCLSMLSRKQAAHDALTVIPCSHAQTRSLSFVDVYQCLSFYKTAVLLLVIWRQMFSDKCAPCPPYGYPCYSCMCLLYSSIISMHVITCMRCPAIHAMMLKMAVLSCVSAAAYEWLLWHNELLIAACAESFVYLLHSSIVMTNVWTFCIYWKHVHINASATDCRAGNIHLLSVMKRFIK